MKKFTSTSIKSNQINNILKGLQNTYIRESVKLILFFSISTLSTIKIIISPEPLGFKDLSPIWSFSQLFRPFDMPWDYKSNLGTPNLLLGNAIYNLPIISFSLIIRDTAIIHKIWLILLFTISGYGFYRLFNRIFGSQVIGVMTGIYGIFNNWLIYHLSLGHNLILFAYAIFPFAVASYLASLKNGVPLEILSTGLLTALIFYISPQIGYILCMFALTYAIVNAFLSENKIERLFKNLVRFASVVFVSLISLLPMAINIFYIGTEVYAIRIEEITTYIMNIDEAFSSQITFTLQTIIILSLGAYIVVKSGSGRLKNVESASLMFTLIILSAVGFLLYSGVSSSLLVFLYSYFPGFMMLRELNKILILGVYLVAFVFSTVLDYLRKFFSFNSLFSLLVISILIGLSAVYPISSGNFAGSLDTVAVPWHYKLVYNALDSETNYYRVAFIPPAVWATHYNWSDHFFLDSVVSLQAKPTLEIKSEMDRTIPARFSRWVYYNLYKKRIKEIGALFGITGVKYIIFRKDAYMPEDRKDLRLFSQKTSREILSVAENIKLVGSIGPIEIFETDYRLPHIYACDKVSLIVGDKRVLLSLLSNNKFDPLFEPPVFIDNLDDIAEIFNYTETIYIDPLRFEDLVLAVAQNKTVYKVWENLPLTSNIHEEWIRGEFAWFLKDGTADVTPDGYAITSSGKSLTLNVNIPKTGNYSLLVQCFLIEDEAFKGIRINLDDEYIRKIKPEGESPLGNYRWIRISEYHLNLGSHKIKITPEGSLKVEVAGILVDDVLVMVVSPSNITEYLSLMNAKSDPVPLKVGETLISRELLPSTVNGTIEVEGFSLKVRGVIPPSTRLSKTILVSSETMEALDMETEDLYYRKLSGAESMGYTEAPSSINLIHGITLEVKSVLSAITYTLYAALALICLVQALHAMNEGKGVLKTFSALGSSKRCMYSSLAVIATVVSAVSVVLGYAIGVVASASTSAVFSLALDIPYIKPSISDAFLSDLALAFVSSSVGLSIGYVRGYALACRV